MMMSSSSSGEEEGDNDSIGSKYTPRSLLFDDTIDDITTGSIQNGNNKLQQQQSRLLLQWDTIYQRT